MLAGRAGDLILHVLGLGEVADLIVIVNPVDCMGRHVLGVDGVDVLGKGLDFDLELTRAVVDE